MRTPFKDILDSIELTKDHDTEKYFVEIGCEHLDKMEIHGTDLHPDDYRYYWMYLMFRYLKSEYYRNYAEMDEEEFETELEDLDKYFLNSYVSFDDFCEAWNPVDHDYYSLSKWLHSNSNRFVFVNEAVDEEYTLPRNGFDLSDVLQIGQMREIRELWDRVTENLEDAYDEVKYED